MKILAFEQELPNGSAGQFQRHESAEARQKDALVGTNSLAGR